MDLRDEFFHDPGTDDAWSESHYVHFVDETVQGHGRIGFYPNRGEANVWAFLTTEEAIYYVADDVVPPAEVHGLTARRPGYTYAHVPDEPGERWRIEWRGEATRVDDSAAVLDGDGEPAAVDMDLTFSDRHDVFYYSDGVVGSPHEGGDDRYEVTCEVSGSVEIDGSVHEVACQGQRDHSWAPREWAGDAEWLYVSGAFEDGTAYHHTTAWLAGYPEEPVYRNGYWFDGTTASPLTDATVAADPQFGRETARSWADGTAPTFTFEFGWDGGETAVTADPIVTTPIEFENERTERRALFNRSAFHHERADGTGGSGWLENPTQFDLS